MAYNPTNANDVELVVSLVERGASGRRTGDTDIVETGRVVVDEFTIDAEEDLEPLSGVGNDLPLGISRGDVEFSFSFTVQGEDAELYQRISEGDSPGAATRAVELELTAIMDQVNVKLEGAFSGTRSLSASSGDVVEFEVEGMATDKVVNTN